MKRARTRKPYRNPWRPIGFYKNRPLLAAKMVANGIGSHTDVRFVESDPLGLYCRTHIRFRFDNVILNDSLLAEIRPGMPPR